MQFTWVRQDKGRYGIRWSLQTDGCEIGACFYMPGSKNYQVRASAPVKGGAVLFMHCGGTASSARRNLEREWHRRSIGLFGLDDIYFVEAA